MNAIIDTSSLRALVRYYLPFEKDSSLKNLIRNKIENNELTILDSVVSEVKYQAQGIVLQELDFLSSKTLNHVQITSTQDLVPYPKFIRRVDNEFCNKDVVSARELTPEEYASEKNRFLNSVDAKIILFADRQTHAPLFVIPGTIVVSEETSLNNDGKVFKKIPVICNMMGIDHCSLTTLLREHFNVKLSNHCH
jgi:hypothetical protein